MCHSVNHDGYTQYRGHHLRLRGCMDVKTWTRWTACRFAKAVQVISLIKCRLVVDYFDGVCLCPSSNSSSCHQDDVKTPRLMDTSFHALTDCLMQDLFVIFVSCVCGSAHEQMLIRTTRILMEKPRRNQGETSRPC